MLAEAQSKGFGNALCADAMGNLAESATANVFLVKDGEVFTPVPNGTFLAGITRARHISNLRADGYAVHETVLSFEDARDADELFLSGNMSKVTPIVLGLGQARRTIAGVKRAFSILLICSPFGLTVVCAAWLMMQSPFSAPLVDRSVDQTRLAIEQAMAREVDLAWLMPRMQDAILAQDMQQILLLLRLANDHGVQLPTPMLADINDLNIAASGVLARTTACGACAIDITACATLAQIGACALPFELTPAGDVNALRRASVTYIEGGDVDQLDVGLAIVGLGATGAVLATGGSSYSLKAGTSVLRMARRLGWCATWTARKTPRDWRG